MGESGAGQSTIMQIIAGIYCRDGFVNRTKAAHPQVKIDATEYDEATI